MTRGKPLSRANAEITAKALGVDLAQVTATGPRGAYTTTDLVDASLGVSTIAARHPAPVPEPSADARPLTLHGRAIQPWLAAENARVPADADVRQAAGEREVRLAEVEGTGPGGRPTMSDVLAVARQQDAQRAAAHRAAFPAPAPEADPVMPPFSASGVDPRALLAGVPAVAWRALAAAETTAEAYRLRERYLGLSDDEARAALAKDRSVATRHGGLATGGAWPQG
ncbi:E3 binding domain-containing protein [Geodermatophilus sp. SYSU D00700]